MNETATSQSGSTIKSQVISKVVAWVSTTLLAILTVFSDTITDHIRTGLNNADARTKSYEKMSQDFSGLIFAAKNAKENYEQALTGSWKEGISPANLNATVTDYNTAITTVETNQYAYRYQVNTYAKWFLWVFRDRATTKYDTLISYVNSLDSAMHLMNPIAIKIEPLVGKKDSHYMLDKDDSAFLRTALPIVNNYLNRAKNQAHIFFDDL